MLKFSHTYQFFGPKGFNKWGPRTATKPQRIRITLQLEASKKLIPALQVFPAITMVDGLPPAESIEALGSEKLICVRKFEHLLWKWMSSSISLTLIIKIFVNAILRKNQDVEICWHVHNWKIKKMMKNWKNNFSLIIETKSEITRTMFWYFLTYIFI